MGADTATDPVRRRKSREDRRQEIVDAAAALGLEEGLHSITARRVAEKVGVGSGLVTHYFPAIDELLAATFTQLASKERGLLAEATTEESSATDQVRMTLQTYLSPSRDAMGLLWLDAWRHAADRHELRSAVISEMEADVAAMEAIIARGVESGEFTIQDRASATAIRILALLDGQAARAAIRAALADSSLDYPAVEHMVFLTAERELGLTAGALTG
jgi:AcrR family transcriptional regulator